MVTIKDLSVELLARIFEGMEVEHAWIARQVCHHWYNVFEFVAFRLAHNVYLCDVEVSVQLTCGITSGGKVIDRHTVHGHLRFDVKRERRQIGAWTAEKKEYDVWPGGQWRMYSIGEALMDATLRFTSSRINIDVGIGMDAAGFRNHLHRTRQIEKFRDFLISIDTLEEASSSGPLHKKHSIVSLKAPIWQIYSLLVYNIKSQKEKEGLILRHYLLSHALSDKSSAHEIEWSGKSMEEYTDDYTSNNSEY